MIVAIAMGLGIAAINTGNNLIYLVFSLSLALIILSGLLSEANLRRIRPVPIKFTRARAREPLPVLIEVECERRRFPSYAIEAWPWVETGALSVRPARFIEVRRGRHGATCRLTFERRGEYRVLGMVVSTEFPFGFFRKSVVYPCDAVIRVHPAIRQVLWTPSDQKSPGDDQGVPRAGRGIEFFGVREFREGDNPRHILHRRSAGLERTVVREFEDTSEREVTIVFANAICLEDEEAIKGVEAQIEEAASLAVHLLRAQKAVGIATLSGFIPPGTGPSQETRILDFLATLPVKVMTRSELESAFAALRANLGEAPVLLALSPRPNGGQEGP